MIINKLSPIPQTTEPDCSFVSNAPKPLGNFNFPALNYVVAAIGPVVHGLHYLGNSEGYTVGMTLNTLDFDDDVNYLLGDKRFQTKTPSVLRTAWSGDSYKSIQTYATQDNMLIGEYKSGNVQVHRVPGFFGGHSRIENDFDQEKYAKFHDYALLSSYNNYLKGEALGSNSFLYSKKLGDTFKIEYMGSTGSASVTRKCRFRVFKYGHNKLPMGSYEVIWDSTVRDYQATSIPNSIITSNVTGNMAISFGSRLHHFNSDGSKCIVGFYIEHLSGLDNDGLNQISTYSIAFVEFTINMNSSGVVTIEGAVTDKFIGSSAFTGNTYVVSNSLPSVPGQLRQYNNADLSTPLRPRTSAVVVLDTQTYTPPPVPPVYTPVMEGTISWYSVLTGGTFPGPNTNYLFALPQDVGQARYVSGGGTNQYKVRRLIHKFYDATDTLSNVTITFVNITSVVVETLVSFDISGTGHHQRRYPIEVATTGTGPSTVYGGYANFCSNGSGTTTVKWKTQRENYNRKSFEFRVDDTLVDYMIVENCLPTSQSETTVVVAYSPPGAQGLQTLTKTATTVNTTDTTPVDLYGPPEAAIVGPLSYHTGSYAPIQEAGAVTGYFRNAAVTSNADYGALIVPFVRLDTSTMFSFHVSSGGHSMITDKEPSTSSNYFFRANYLGFANHFRKTTYDGYHKRVAENNIPGFGMENPIKNIPGFNCYCSVDPVTKQSVTNHAGPVTFM